MGSKIGPCRCRPNYCKVILPTVKQARELDGKVPFETRVSTIPEVDSGARRRGERSAVEARPHGPGLWCAGSHRLGRYGGEVEGSRSGEVVWRCLIRTPDAGIR